MRLSNWPKVDEPGVELDLSDSKSSLSVTISYFSLIFFTSDRLGGERLMKTDKHGI